MYKRSDVLKIYIRLLMLALLAARAYPCVAQPCPQYPATCPENTASGWGTTDDSISRMLNPLVPREVAMENRLRQWATAVVNTIAKKEGWDVVEITEGAAAGYRDTDDAVLVYERRPAHWFRMTWQFLINKDSLQAWREWLSNFSQQRMDVNSQYMTRVTAQQSNIQAYMDSANHYGELKAKYMTDHFAQYQKDLVAGNKSGIAAYEKGVAVYDQRANFFINKAAALQKDPQTEKANSDADQESVVQKLRFSDATVVIFELDFNNETATVAGRPVSTGASPSVKWFRNPEPDMLDNVNIFTHSRNMALWLIGPWDAKPDNFGNYHPHWMADGKNRKIISYKTIKSDKVQNIYCQLSGNAEGMRRVLADLPAEEMERMIARQ